MNVIAIMIIIAKSVVAAAGDYNIVNCVLVGVCMFHANGDCCLMP